MLRRGFTIVELIIVIAVIGILVSIVTLTYIGTQNKAHDVAVQSDLETISGILESYRTNPDNNSDYPHDATALGTLDIKATKKSYDQTLNVNLIYCASSDYSIYAVGAKSKSGNIYEVTPDGGVKLYTMPPSTFTNTAFCPIHTANTIIASGMTAPNTWASWVGAN